METKHFADDLEKMLDFCKLTKEDFLASYSYLTEEEYLATENEIERRKRLAKFDYRYMIYDTQEGYYDVYLFEIPIEIKKLEEVIRECKEDMQGKVCADWDLEDIEKVIRANFPVKDLILFEKGDNAKEVMDI